MAHTKVRRTFFLVAIVSLASWRHFSLSFTEPRFSRRQTGGISHRVSSTQLASYDVEDDYGTSRIRRFLITASVAIPLLANGPLPARAAHNFFSRLAGGGTPESPTDLYVVAPGVNATAALQRESVNFAEDAKSVEQVLLRLLPVNNALFQELRAVLDDGVTPLTRTGSNDAASSSVEIWSKVAKTINATIVTLDRRRSQLAPAFNPDENSVMQVEKGTRGEALIEALRARMVDLVIATSSSYRFTNVTNVAMLQRQALLALAEVGELLVSKFPYNVPVENAYSYLPRLLGRCKVTFTFARKGQALGNVTIVADGYTAPITAGNFVDLSLRNYYSGLPVKVIKKRLGSSSALGGIDFDVVSLPILGSFQDEGFYDPLTGKPRKIPLEVIRVQKSSGIPTLSYARGLSSLPDDIEAPADSRPLVSFDSVPGVVALNHPINNPNGGSTEFFALQPDSVVDEKRALFNGEYAPFGYIIDGRGVFSELRANDVLTATFVDDWGLNNLVKIRQSSLSEVFGGSDDETVE